MAYTLTLQHIKTKETKKAPVGFSWTSLFFGAIPSLLRKDWLTGITYALVLLLIHLTEVLAEFSLNSYDSLVATLLVLSITKLVLIVSVAIFINASYNRRLARRYVVMWDKTVQNNPQIRKETLLKDLCNLGYSINYATTSNVHVYA